jgi:hypothetical protein
MKKITFILLALIAGTVFAQDTNTETATASAGAEIIQPITITKNNDLNFGRIIGTALGGTVTVDDADLRTSGATGILDPSTTGTANISTAKFTITAAEGYLYGISIPAIVTLSGSGGADMIVTLNPYYEGSALIPATTPKGTSTAETLMVGGDLAVGLVQGQGAYTANFDVTVTYE